MAKFTEEQKKFIVKAFEKSPSSSIVRREFNRHYKISGRQASKLCLLHFFMVNANFDKNGTIHRKDRTTTQAPIKRSPEKIEEIFNFIAQNKRNSVRKSSQLVDISDTTLWRVVKKDLRVNLFHSKCVQPLTEAHKEQRMKFWRCLLEQPNPEIFIINDIWTDEKYFCLHQKSKHVQRQVYASNPSTINEVVAIVKQYAVRCSEDVLKRVR